MGVLKPWIRADNFQTNYDFIEHQRMQVKNYVKTGFIEETNKTVNHPVNFGDKISIKRLPFDNCIKFPDFWNMFGPGLELGECEDCEGIFQKYCQVLDYR